jgi:arylsulfatase A-like enzyme
MTTRRRRAPAGLLLSTLPLLVLAALLVGCAPERRAEGSAPAGSGAPRTGARPDARPDVLLLTIDTLRADHLSAWGYARETSPNLDRMASEGVRFERAQVQWPKTAPSFASMFTATYPKDNGVVRRVGMPISCRLRLLAEEMRELGYQTHAVVANGALAKEFFFDQGFDSYEEAWKTGGSDTPEPTGARRITDLALARVDRLEPGRPAFLWIHYIDPHAPYRPPRPWRDLFQGDPHFRAGETVPVDRSARRRFVGAIGRSQVVDGGTDRAFYVARYDAEIRYVDAEVGRLIAGLEQRGRWQRMLSVMTSDHGESLGEHRYYFGHGMLAYQTCLHVPFVVRYPGVLAPRTDPSPVELLHLAPTILELAGAPLRDGRWGQGRSLAPRLRGEASGDATLAFSEAGYASDRMWLRAVYDGRFKLVFAPSVKDQRKMGRQGNAYALFDLAEDPGERRDVGEIRAAERERLRAALAEWDAAPRFRFQRDTAECGDGRDVDRSTEAQLRSLGYL